MSSGGVRVARRWKENENENKNENNTNQSLQVKIGEDCAKNGG